MVHSLARMNSIKDLLFFVVSVRWNNQGDGFVDCLVRAKAEQFFRSSIPAGNNTIQILANDGVVRRLNDGGQMTAGIFVTFAFRDIAQVGGEYWFLIALERGYGELD